MLRTMVWDSKNLQTRQFERHATRLWARIEIASEHVEQLRFSFADVQDGITVIDISDGGIGLQTGVYLPKNARVVVRIRESEADAGTDVSVLGIVRRCLMVDVKPTYQVGLQFLDAAGVDRSQLAGMIRTAQAGIAPAPAPTSDAAGGARNGR